MRIYILSVFFSLLFVVVVGDDAVITKLKDFSTVFREIAHKASSGVVSIEVSKTVELLEDPYGLNRFFGLSSNKSKRTKKKVEIGAGSGFIADQEGHVLTNFHVIEEGQEIAVILKDGRRSIAKYIGGDAGLDLAVLRISLENLTPLEFGDSSSVEVGDWVLAIGNPYGYSHTVTEGIISAKYRENNSLQTSAAINPGNSGGPLLNLEGKVIGINRSIKTTTGANIGIGFAMPINIVKQALKDIVQTGKIKYATIGASFVDTNSRCVADKIFLDSPAKEGHLLRNDIIVQANGIDVFSSSQLQAILAELRKGDIVELKVQRSSGLYDLKLELTDKAEWEAKKTKEFIEKLGVRYVLLDDAAQDRYGVLVNFGVFIVDSQKSKFSTLKQGDVILAINGMRIDTEASFLEISSSLESKSVTLTILRKRSYWDQILKFD